MIPLSLHITLYIMTHPTYGHGKICYIQIPATDVAASAAFFQKVFNWRIRDDNHGNISFDDAVGEVSGMWFKGGKPVAGAGMIISIMVKDAAATVEAIIANGGIITQPINKEAPEITAHFTDIAGNEWGIYQERGL
jgi:predicted enzyme related to lactoylglutathione lyase